MKRTDEHDGFELTAGYGSVSVRRVRPGVVSTRYSGLLSSDVFEPVSGFAAEEMARCGRLHLFVDAERMRSYDADFRRAWSGWLKAHRDGLGSVHLLIRSRFVQMGLNLVRPLVGEALECHHERESFERALDAAGVKTIDPPDPISRPVSYR